GVPEAEEMPDLVKRDRLDVLPARLAAGRRRPREHRIEEDVRLDHFAGQAVERERRRAEHAVEIGTVLEPDDGHAVAGGGIRARETDELRGNPYSGHR